MGVSRALQACWDTESEGGPHHLELASTGGSSSSSLTIACPLLVGRRRPAAAAAFLDQGDGQLVQAAHSKGQRRHQAVSFLFGLFGGGGKAAKEPEWSWDIHDPNSFPSKSELTKYLPIWKSSCPEWMPGAFSDDYALGNNRSGGGFCKAFSNQYAPPYIPPRQIAPQRRLPLPTEELDEVMGAESPAARPRPKPRPHKVKKEEPGGLIEWVEEDPHKPPRDPRAMAEELEEGHTNESRHYEQQKKAMPKDMGPSQAREEAAEFANPVED